MVKALTLWWYHWSSAEFLDELQIIRLVKPLRYGRHMDLLERFVVDKSGGIFWNFQLPFLDVLPELPGKAC